jgi:hypothetical protein
MAPERPRRSRHRLGVAQRYQRMAPGTPCRRPVPGGGPERRAAIGPGIASTPLARLARRRPVRLGRLEYEILGGRRVQRCIDEHLKGDPLQIGFSLAFQ